MKFSTIELIQLNPVAPTVADNVSRSDAQDTAMTLTYGKVILTLVACTLIAGCATGGHRVEASADVSCIGRAAVLLVDAIAAAEETLHQPVIDAEYDMDWQPGCASGDAGHYDMTVYVSGELRRVTVDARSGKVGPAHHERSISRVFGIAVVSDWPEAEMLHGAPAAIAAPTRMHEAVRLAERNGAKAFAAHIKTQNKTLSYMIEIAEAGQSRLVSVDLDTGTVRE
jgi:uncharacterized membrane protein YkoI